MEVTEVSPGDKLSIAGLDVRVAATDHRPVEPTVAYRVGYSPAHFSTAFRKRFGVSPKSLR